MRHKENSTSNEIKFDKQLRKPLPSAERIINSLTNLEISSFDTQEIKSKAITNKPTSIAEIVPQIKTK